jgi:hypothetical protein
MCYTMCLQDSQVCFLEKIDIANFHRVQIMLWQFRKERIDQRYENRVRDSRRRIECRELKDDHAALLFQLFKRAKKGSSKTETQKVGVLLAGWTPCQEGWDSV